MAGSHNRKGVYAPTLQAVSVTVLALVGLMGCSSGHSDSYDAGYKSSGGREWATQMLMNQSPDVICTRMYELRSERTKVADKSDFIQGCEDGLEDAVE